MSLAVYLLLVPSMSISKNTRGLIFILGSVLKREKGRKKKKRTSGTTPRFDDGCLCNEIALVTHFYVIVSHRKGDSV